VEGQGFRAVHFVEMRFVDSWSAATRGPPTPTLPRKGEGEERLAFSAEDTVFFFALTGTLAASPYFFVPAYFS
jgi:hypothetical protein